MTGARGGRWAGRNRSPSALALARSLKYRRFMAEPIMKRQGTALTGVVDSRADGGGFASRGWGAICLHREDAEHGFDDREVDVIRRIAPHVAEGLRRAVTLGPFRPFADSTALAGAPGIILLDQDLALMTMSPEAAQWLAEIDEADWPIGSELPMAVYAAAARLARLEQGAAPPKLADTIRLRSRAGQWLSLHASRLGGGPALQIGIVIEPPPAAQLSSLLLSAYGLTGAQSRVVALVIRGHSTRQIVEELHISANTVQEHLTAAFDKFGVRSRRELVTAMLTGRPG